MKLRGIIVLALALFATPALAQVTPGTSPLTVPKGGTGVSSLPDCTDSGGNHLNYSVSSKVFTCGTTGALPFPLATNADYLAGTANKILQAGAFWQTETVTTFGSTTTFDFSTFKNTQVTLTGNITTQTLTNVIVGKAGMITFIQDATGSRTTVWNSLFKFSGGVTPTLTTTPNAVDILTFSCRTATFCAASLLTDVR